MSVENILQEIIIRLERLEQRLDDLEPIEANQNIVGFAAPTTQVDLAANPGVLNTALRSDAGLALDVAIAPTWTAAHIFRRAGLTLFHQNGVAAVVPVIQLDQDDVSEGFIEFLGSDRGVITGATNSVESVRVELNGVVRRIALYANA